MSKFELVEKNKYKIMGTITEEDINTINNFKNRTTLILDNTAGISSELVSKITSDKIVFSIKGGLDYDKKEKYKEQRYIDRTLVSPSGLKKIIEYFEYNESMIDSNWNEFEKAMFLYNALVVDMEYAEDYEKIQSPKTTERSLNGILYGKLVCSGFAQVYKEMLDRVGIKNYYQNQRDIHSFNIIEINGKKYGVDVTWDNNSKKDNNGRCGFGKFGHTPDFYNLHGHQLYKEVDVSDDFDIPIIEKKYDKDEEIFDLSLLSMDQLNQYYSHILPKINTRKSFRYNLQDQPIEIKNKYLPVDLVGLRLKQEADQEYPITVIIDFLKNRNSLQVNSQLIEAFSSRKAYLLDMVSNEKIRHDLDLSLIGIDNYMIDGSGNIKYNNGKEAKYNTIFGVDISNSNLSKEEISELNKQLNKYLNEYLNKYISNIIKNLNSLLANYEYKPDEWDANRAVENANIYSKLTIVANSYDYLIQLGISEQEVNSIIQKIKGKYNEIHKPYENNIEQKEHDLDFLSAIFEDLNMIWQTIEYDLHKQITEEEFISLFSNTEYIIKLSEKYFTIAGNKKFNFDEYDISKEELQQLLSKIINESDKMINSNKSEKKL